MITNLQFCLDSASVKPGSNNNNNNSNTNIICCAIFADFVSCITICYTKVFPITGFTKS